MPAKDNTMLFYEEYMRVCIAEAKKAAAVGEVPVGAIVVHGNDIISRAHNMVETLRDPTAHAEILAIRGAAEHLGMRRLAECTLYVTLEPCVMCAGAILSAGLKRLVYGAFSDTCGACASVANIFELGFGEHVPFVRSGVLAPKIMQECGSLLTEFFKKNRKQL